MVGRLSILTKVDAPGSVQRCYPASVLARVSARTDADSTVTYAKTIVPFVEPQQTEQCAARTITISEFNDMLQSPNPETSIDQTWPRRHQCCSARMIIPANKLAISAIRLCVTDDFLSTNILATTTMAYYLCGRRVTLSALSGVTLITSTDPRQHRCLMLSDSNNWFHRHREILPASVSGHCKRIRQRSQIQHKSVLWRRAKPLQIPRISPLPFSGHATAAARLRMSVSPAG